jgi:ABC-type glycerol-3-phosphate transport system substrate-binding protein
MTITTVKIQEYGYLVNGNMSVPNDPANSDYQAILDWINEGNTPTGPDVIEPDYVALRTGPDGYAPIHEQLAMQTDGTWDAHVADVKTRFPKSNTGSTTIGAVPQDILDAAANKLFAQQVEAYKIAKARVAQYQLSVGVPESSETIVTGQEWNEEAEEMQDVTETFVIPAIPALEATVEVTTYEMGEDPVTATVANPLIVKDNEERAAAQAIIDTTPGPVKAHVNG